MLKVYGRNNSVNVQKVMWTVGELGLEHDRIDAGGAFGKVDEDWYLKMNPMGRVPVIDDLGFMMYESNAIVRYLCAKHAQGSLYPDDVRARGLADQWMDWQQTVLLAPMTTVFWGLVRTPEEERDMDAITAAADEVGHLFERLDRHLAGPDYIAGSALTMGDFPLGTMVYRWYGLDIERPDLPSVRAWYDRLTQREAFQQHVMLPIT